MVAGLAISICPVAPLFVSSNPERILIKYYGIRHRILLVDFQALVKRLRRGLFAFVSLAALNSSASVGRIFVRFICSGVVLLTKLNVALRTCDLCALQLRH